MKRSEKKSKTDWNWSTYFANKVQKLSDQFAQNRNELSTDIDEVSKNIFKGIGIFVMGFTNPTSIELKSLMLKHGGIYYEYLNDRVTHVIASNLAHSKAVTYKNRKVVRPEWIVDSINKAQLLNISAYVLQTSLSDKAQNKLTGYVNEAIPTTSRSLKRKSLARDEYDVIDLCNSPLSDQEPQQLNTAHLEKSIYEKDFLIFDKKLNDIANTKINSKVFRPNSSELKLECAKHMLNDWIYFTSKNNNAVSCQANTSRASASQIDAEDLQTFKNYLLYLLIVRRDLELLTLVFKIFKRLIQKNGSFEWIEAYKELQASVQAEFYEKFNSTIKLD